MCGPHCQHPFLAEPGVCGGDDHGAGTGIPGLCVARPRCSGSGLLSCVKPGEARLIGEQVALCLCHPHPTELRPRKGLS